MIGIPLPTSPPDNPWECGLFQRKVKADPPSAFVMLMLEVFAHSGPYAAPSGTKDVSAAGPVRRATLSSSWRVTAPRKKREGLALGTPPPDGLGAVSPPSVFLNEEPVTYHFSISSVDRLLGDSAPPCFEYVSRKRRWGLALFSDTVHEPEAVGCLSFSYSDVSCVPPKHRDRVLCLSGCAPEPRPFCADPTLGCGIGGMHSGGWGQGGLLPFLLQAWHARCHEAEVCHVRLYREADSPGAFSTVLSRPLWCQCIVAHSSVCLSGYPHRHCCNESLFVGPVEAVIGRCSPQVSAVEQCLGSESHVTARVNGLSSLCGSVGTPSHAAVAEVVHRPASGCSPSSSQAGNRSTFCQDGPSPQEQPVRNSMWGPQRQPSLPYSGLHQGAPQGCVCS